MSRVIMLVSLFLAGLEVQARSVRRPQRDEVPTITMSYKGEPTKHTLKNWYLEEYPYFKLYNATYLQQFHLPDQELTHRYAPDVTSNGAQMKKKIDDLIASLHTKKKISSDFILLQDKDYNYQTHCGLVVVKFKDHPFVVKLFMEDPKSLVNPYSKGIEPMFFFFMGGGVNRHLSGFTRIRNRELVLSKIEASEKWAGKVDIPRKWFHIPSASKSILMTGANIGPSRNPSIEIPSIYCIVADAIQAKKYSYSTKPGALELCNDLGLMIDPHITNFMTEPATGKLVIVDTEHFPSVVGLKEPKRFKSHLQWYFHLMSKYVRDTFFKSKWARRNAQQNPQGFYLTY